MIADVVALAVVVVVTQVVMAESFDLARLWFPCRVDATVGPLPFREHRKPLHSTPGALFKE